MATIREYDPATLESLREAGPVAVRGMPEEDYHAHHASGSSSLEDFRKSREGYHGRYVRRTAPPMAPSKAMQFGTLVDIYLLTPELAAERIAAPLPELAPDGKKWLRRKGSDHEKWWADELAKREGKIAANEDDIKRALSVVHAVKQHDLAGPLFDEGESQVSIFWSDRSGLPCKCRLDWLNPKVPVDLKTTSFVAPAEYAKQCVTLGYHRKMAHYQDGLKAWAGKDLPLAHIAAETEWPFRVAFYEIDDTDSSGASLGHTERRATLTALAKCLKEDDWREPWERGVARLSLPAWAHNQSAYQMGDA